MRRTVAFIMIFVGLTGCGWFQGSEPQPANDDSTSTEVKSSGSPPAKIVYVTYHGPERLTRRFGKFFEIAADDHGIKIAGNPRDADAQMEVTITDEDAHKKFNAKVLHAGFVLRGGKSATLDYCEEVNSSDEVASDFFYPIYARGLVEELKKSQPTVAKTFVDPINSNLDPYFAEIVKRELVKAGYVTAANATDADAVLRTMGTTLESIGANAIKRRVRIRISGAVTFSYDANSMLYKSIDKPLSQRSKPCLANAESYLSPSSTSSYDNFWNSATSAARALAKL